MGVPYLLECGQTRQDSWFHEWPCSFPTASAHVPVPGTQRAAGRDLDRAGFLTRPKLRGQIFRVGACFVNNPLLPKSCCSNRTKRKKHKGYFPVLVGEVVYCRVLVANTGACSIRGAAVCVRALGAGDGGDAAPVGAPEAHLAAEAGAGGGGVGTSRMRSECERGVQGMWRCKKAQRVQRSSDSQPHDKHLPSEFFFLFSKIKGCRRTPPLRASFFPNRKGFFREPSVPGHPGAAADGAATERREGPRGGAGGGQGSALRALRARGGSGCKAEIWLWFKPNGTILRWVHHPR